MTTDAIPVSDIAVVGGNAPVLDWPIISTLHAFSVEGGTLHTVYGGQGQWPIVLIGDPPTPQEATIWVVVKVNGRWIGAGLERLRPNQIDKPEIADTAGLIADWAADKDALVDLAHIRLVNGDRVGICVACGDTRLTTNTQLEGRTAIVLAKYWDGRLALVDPTPVPDPDPEPPAPPTPDPALDALREEIERLKTEVARLSAIAGYLTPAVADQGRRLAALEARPTTIRTSRSWGHAHDVVLLPPK